MSIRKGFATSWSIHNNVVHRNYKVMCMSLMLITGGITLSFLLPHPLNLIASSILAFGAFAYGTGVLKLETCDPKFDEHTKF